MLGAGGFWEKFSPLKEREREAGERPPHPLLYWRVTLPDVLTRASRAILWLWGGKTMRTAENLPRALMWLLPLTNPGTTFLQVSCYLLCVFVCQVPSQALFMCNLMGENWLQFLYRSLPTHPLRLNPGLSCGPHPLVSVLLAEEPHRAGVQEASSWCPSSHIPQGGLTGFTLAFYPLAHHFTLTPILPSSPFLHPSNDWIWEEKKWSPMPPKTKNIWNDCRSLKSGFLDSW